MNVRDLERLLTAFGVGAAKMDGTTRRLREIGRLPLGGRGTNAPEIAAENAAAVLVAVAGSGKAIEADNRLAKLEESAKAQSGETIVAAISRMLDHPAELETIAEVRVSRTSRSASVHHTDGRVDRYGDSRSASRPTKFRVEGVLPSSLLKTVSNDLKKGGSS